MKATLHLQACSQALLQEYREQCTLYRAHCAVIHIVHTAHKLNGWPNRNSAAALDSLAISYCRNIITLCLVASQQTRSRTKNALTSTNTSGVQPHNPYFLCRNTTAGSLLVQRILQRVPKQDTNTPMLWYQVQSRPPTSSHGQAWTGMMLE